MANYIMNNIITNKINDFKPYIAHLPIKVISSAALNPTKPFPINVIT